MKKSDSLAVANAERIAAQLRAERNEAVALAQVKRELLDRALAVLGEIRHELPNEATLANGANVQAEIDALIERAAR